MADYPLQELDGRTPLEAARTPNMDFIAKIGKIGRVKTVPGDMTPGSDVANISIMGYDPKAYYTGRGPFEAANLGIEMEDDDVAFRCNLITAEGDILTDYSAGHISSEEAAVLVKFIDKRLGTNRFRFFPGVSYRHLMMAKRAAEEHLERLECKPPHDISGKSISKNFPKGEGAEAIIELMKESRKMLDLHEVNQVRVDLKENPANMIWLWGQGKKPNMPSFMEKYGVNGGVISAVDLLKGIGRVLGMDVINVPGATGYYDTDYEGKGDAALKYLKDKDFIFVHVEAPDEAGHNGDLREKIAAIERFDQFILGKILEVFKPGGDFRLLLLPDHATPIKVRTHTSDEVPFVICGKDIVPGGFTGYSEKEAVKSDIYFEEGFKLMDYFIKGQSGG